VRLTDYAHAALPSAESSRVSKKAVNAAVKSIRETRHWWECDEDDFFDDLAVPDGGNESEEEEEVDQEQNGKTLSNGKKDRRKTLAAFTTTASDSTIDSTNYPPDLWYLISDYIRPEDVGRFASICRYAYNVTRSSGFWRQLYRRFYDPKACNNIPEQFRPLALKRPYGLRTRVIKALYCCYGRFTERTRCTNGVSLSAVAVGKLCRGICESTWWEQQQDAVSGKTVWRFYFKFRGRQSSRALPSKFDRVRNARHHFSTGSTSLDYLDDIWANLEDDCCILKVTCHQYTQIPTILGWRLSELNLSLCSDMRSHRLRLTFGEATASKAATTKISAAREIAVLDSVQTVAMFDWYHPNYPSAVL